MKRLTILSAFLFSVTIVFAQNNFPNLKAKNLLEDEVQIPVKGNEKMTLVGIAFSKKSEEDLKGWFQPAYNTFINPPKNSLIPVDSYDANVYFVAMLKGIAKSASGKIYKKMQEGVPSELHEYILLYADEFKPYKQKLDFGAKDVPYFYVLDASGEIKYSTYGEFTEEKFDEILSHFEE